MNQETQEQAELAEYEAPRVEEIDALQGTALTAVGNQGSVTTVSQPK